MNPARALRYTSILTCMTLSPSLWADPGTGFPTKPVRVVIGPPANFTDIVTRRLAEQLHAMWRQPVIVENRSSGMMGAGVVAKSLADGYTLLVSDRTWQSVAGSLYRDLPYEPARDFVGISHIASTPILLVAHPSIPATNLKELVGYAKQHQPTLSYATAGIGTATHLPGEQLKQLTGIELTAVHYKGGGAAMVAMLGGEVKIGFNPVLLALPHVKAGRMKAYAITSKRRFMGAPDIPTMVEAGLAALEADYWIGLFAPNGVPPGLIDKVNRDVSATLASATMRAYLLDQAAESIPGTASQFTAFVKEESRKWGLVIRTAGIKPE